MNAAKNSTKNDPRELPDAGPKKNNPKELDRMLDKALEDSMAASDPPAVTQPDVKTDKAHTPPKEDAQPQRGNQVGNKI